jgi:catechol 2,3-dioxygenase-like lactoylglutathione lyase family enzyme
MGGPPRRTEKIMVPRLNIIDIVVSDMDAAIAFYGRLGLEFKVDPGMPGHAGCDVPGGPHVMLNAEDFRASSVPGWSVPGEGSRILLCFEFDDAAGVNDMYAGLVAAGHRGLTEPFDAFWGMRYATVADPDGNGVALYAPLPAR